MQKILALITICFSLIQAKMFIGIDGGYNIYGRSESGSVKSSVWSNTKPNGWYVGVNLGNEVFKNDYFGFRVFLDTGISRGISVKQFKVINAGLNTDALINFVVTQNFSLGIFVGAGAGYEYVSLGKITKFESLPVYGRIGLTTSIGESSRIDFTLRPPIVSYKFNKNSRFVSSSLLLQVGYKFLF